MLEKNLKAISMAYFCKLGVKITKECLDCKYLIDSASNRYKCYVKGSCPVATLSEPGKKYLITVLEELNK